ncbi:MAG: hypothetical protein AB8G23_02875 [Myxococcota bacterium]
MPKLNVASATRTLRVLLPLLLGLVVAPGMASAVIFFGPVPYLSSSDVPVGLYASGVPDALDDFEDFTLDFGIVASGGQPLGLSMNVDSVDEDDGVVDGNGFDGTSWFIGDLGNFSELTFNFESVSGALPTAAGIVWTDGAANHQVVFEAFGPGGVSLGMIGPFSLSDDFNTGETAEDRFFGVSDDAGIQAIRIRNQGAFGGLEVDHVQFGTAVPEPSAALLVGCVGLLALSRRRG